MSVISVETKPIAELTELTALTGTDELLIQNGATSRKIKYSTLRDQILKDRNDYLNEGRDLTVVFATEIAGYASVWAWIQARLNARNLNDLRAGDYIPIQLSTGENVIMQIAGICTHVNIFSGEVLPHIDWISKDCLANTHEWNALATHSNANDNNGTAAEKQPFIASDLYAWLNNTVFPTLPSALRSVVKSKTLYMPTRYNQSSKLTDDNSWEKKSFTGLWLPFECEIFEHNSWSTKGYGTAAMVQYEIFRNSWKARMKRQGNDGSFVIWWSASAYSGSSTNAVLVSTYGIASNYSVSNSFGVPVCFRTMADE